MKVLTELEVTDNKKLVLTKKQIKIILINFAGWFEWDRRNIKGLNKVFKKLDLKGI